MIPHRPFRTLGRRPGTPRPGDPWRPVRSGEGTAGGACWHRMAMTSFPERRLRLVALLLVAILVTGFAATVSVSAAPALPSCRVADTLTKHRLYGDWAKSLLDL